MELRSNSTLNSENKKMNIQMHQILKKTQEKRMEFQSNYSESVFYVNPLQNREKFQIDGDIPATVGDRLASAGGSGR